MCYLRMRQDNTLLLAAMMAHADTVSVCSLPLAKNAMHSPTSKKRVIGERERANLVVRSSGINIYTSVRRRTS